MAGVEAVRVMAVLDDAVEGLRYAAHLEVVQPWKEHSIAQMPFHLATPERQQACIRESAWACCLLPGTNSAGQQPDSNASASQRAQLCGGGHSAAMNGTCTAPTRSCRVSLCRLLSYINAPVLRAVDQSGATLGKVQPRRHALLHRSHAHTACGASPCSAAACWCLHVLAWHSRPVTVHAHATPQCTLLLRIVANRRLWKPSDYHIFLETQLHCDCEMNMRRRCCRARRRRCGAIARRCMRRAQKTTLPMKSCSGPRLGCGDA